MGIEPTLSAWKAEVLPLNYTRIVYYAYREHPPIRGAVARLNRQSRPVVRFVRCLRDPATSMRKMVEGGGFEPPKAEPTDLQSVPFGRSGTPPKK